MKTLTVIGVFVTASFAYQFFNSFDPDELQGKRVVITGASSGIGEQLAYQYSRFGARILITARRGHVLQQVVAKCKELGAQDAHFIALDMGDSNSTKQLIEEAKNKLGGIDHLILNHIMKYKMEMWNEDSMSYLRDTMDVNFHSYVNLATYATPLLNESKGSIAVVSSILGKVTGPLTSSYNAAKFALDGFFSTLRQEFEIQKVDISVTLCIIGTINTAAAVERTQDIVRPQMFYTSPVDTAYRIMTGVTLRERDVYYPWSQTRTAMIMNDWSPYLMETFLRRICFTEGAFENKKT